MPDNPDVSQSPPNGNILCFSCYRRGMSSACFNMIVTGSRPGRFVSMGDPEKSVCQPTWGGLEIAVGEKSFNVCPVCIQENMVLLTVFLMCGVTCRRIPFAPEVVNAKPAETPSTTPDPV